MNCQHVIGILDSGRFDQIDSGQRQQVEAHVATCADCARAWNAQSTLATLPDMRMPAGLQAQCLAAVAARFPTAPAAVRPGHRHVLVWSSLATLAAAAATLALLSTTETRTAPAETVQTPEETASPLVDVATAVQPASADPTRPHAAVSDTAAAPQFTVEVVVPEPPPTGQPAGQKELHAIATDPVARDALESLRAALVVELGKVPDLAVVTDVPARIVAPSRHYRLRLGPLLMIGVDGRPMRREHQYNMSLGVQEVRPGGSTIARRLPFGGFAVDPLASCTSPDAVARMSCDATTTAVFLVRQLRQQVFPADASVTQPLQARLRDFSLAPDERFQAFVELFRQQAKVGGTDLFSDPDVVRAAVELSQFADAAHRAQLWRALRGVGDASLIDPLMASMQEDSEKVRVAAIETLAADFKGDPRARPALEMAAVSDPSPLVRALARRGLSGEEAWQNYVVASLKDSTLPASQRVEALLHALYAPDSIDGIPDGSPANYWQILKGLDDGAVRALAEVFPRAGQLRKAPGNNLLGNFASVHNQNPAVREMLLTVLEQDTRASNRSVAGEALAQGHASQPRVRDALTRAARSDPDASVRDYLRQVLEREPVKKAMGVANR